MNINQIPLSALAVTPVHSLRSGDTLRCAIALLQQFNIDQLPVLTPDGQLLGVVTSRQLSAERRDWGEVEASEIAAELPADRVRHEDTRLGEVSDLLFEHDFVLISNDGRTVTGIVTINDVVRYRLQTL